MMGQYIYFGANYYQYLSVLLLSIEYCVTLLFSNDLIYVLTLQKIINR